MFDTNRKYEPLPVQDDDISVSSPSTRRSFRSWSLTACLVTLIAASIVISVHPAFLFSNEDEASSIYTDLSGEALKQCAALQPPPADPPAPINIWSSLTVHETTSVQAWLEAPERALNLTRTSISKLSDNVIFMIELYYPPKADALAYLESPETVSPPERYARVTIHHGSVPVIRDYLVGPLPIGGKTTTMEPLTEIYHREDIPFHAAGYATGSELSTMISTFAPLYEEAFWVRTWLLL